MNPYLPTNQTSGNTLTNSPINAGVRPQLDASVPVRPIRMEQMIPNERNINRISQQNYQQYQPQNEMYQNRPQTQQIHQQQNQNNVFQNQPNQQINAHRSNSQNLHNNQPQNHPSQQQINIQRNNSQHQNNPLQNHPQQLHNQEKPGVFSPQDSIKLQINSAPKPSVPDRYNQSGGIPSESQRTQMVPPFQHSDPRQSIRPPLNNTNNGTFLNQNQSPHYKKMETSNLPNDRTQPNLQNDNAENYKGQFLGNNSANPIKKPFDMNPPSFNVTGAHPKLNESTFKSQMEAQPGNASNIMADTERKPDLMDIQATPLESKSEQNAKPEYNEVKNSSESNNETMAKSGMKKLKKNKKEDNENGTKGDSITSGMVRKNIKYFEEKDTAKKPLTPSEVTVKSKKRERDTVVPSNVIKSEFHKNNYESGVDETPVVHPNLGNISQVPRKVARIPYLTAHKRLRKKRTERNKFKPPSKFCHNKSSKIRTFGSNEELLAFFESSKSWRKFNRYDKSTAEQRAAKDKLVYKTTTNGDISPKKTPSRLPAPSKINPPGSPTKSPLKSPGTPGTPGTKSLPKTPESTAPVTPLIKKVPMNKIQVGAAPSPNLKTVRSKVGSLANTTHKPGGGNVKIENRKIDLSKAQPRIEAKNDQYKPSGGDKKIAQVKLQWSAKSKVGSLENSTYKPGGGDKKIESVKLDFKEKAKPKVGSKDNVKHVPGGGNIKIENQKLEFKAQSKVGSLDNVKHKPGGGDIKIFDDKTYLRQVSGNSEGRASGTQSYGERATGYKFRSAPATPARKTTVEIKKVTTLQNFEDAPKVEKVTEVVVTSQTLKNRLENYGSPIKQQVKVTYSKVSSLKNEDAGDHIEMLKVPAKDYAPILKPSLSKRDVSDNYESEGNKKIYDF